MLISKVPDEDGGKGECPQVNNYSHEYQTANELFELMAKNQNFDASVGDTLTPRDLVLLYKNIDLGTKLMSNATDLTTRTKANQHVETVVYHGDPESDGSDISDDYSKEDLHNIYLINKERLDLLNIPSSVDNKLCHKFGDLEIQTADGIDYNRQFVFKNPLQSFNVLSCNGTDVSVLPASLLDYVCCKRLEDNYKFYMDNIIRYVKNTIEQLKSISNGDYLTERTKEKWKEVGNVEENSLTNTKVLATSTSIPLHVECKIGNQTSLWDDLVHSEVDIRSLSKILEKKIIVEVPKSLTSSYKLLSKCCADNLIISCQKESIKDHKKESRVDVVFKLKRSETGPVVSNISSIMILQTASIPKVLQDIPPDDATLALLYNDSKNIDCLVSTVKITEIIDNNDNSKPQTPKEAITVDDPFLDDSDVNDDSYETEKEDDYENSETSFLCQTDESCFASAFETHFPLKRSSDSIYNLCNNIDEIQIHAPKEASFDVCPADLRLTMQKLSIQSAVLEENSDDLTPSIPMKKKSRARIKSPYENQSHALEEKKRKKLLEIREKREKKKIALAETCKISKNKFGNRVPLPQASSSVTKLSITNKSFYNSIYGASSDVSSKLIKNRHRKGEIQKQINDADVAFENLETEEELSISQDNKKFINRSYYLDDAVTEMMYLNMKQEDKDLASGSTSCISSDFRANLKIISHLIRNSDTDANADDSDDKIERDETLDHPAATIDTTQITNQENTTPESPIKVIETCKPTEIDKSEKETRDLRKMQPSIECRKSIEKIYKLITNMGIHPNPDNKSVNKYPTNRSNITETCPNKGSLSIQGSDSGTSLKHNLESSYPSTNSFDKNNNLESTGDANKSAIRRSVTPKVIISTKSQIPVPKTELEKNKKDRNAIGVNPSKSQDPNPLKAISQLLHEFENVQRNRLKPGKEQKPARKSDINSPINNNTSPRRINIRQGSSKRRSRLEQHGEVMEQNVRLSPPKEKKVKPVCGADSTKIPCQSIPIEDKNIDKSTKKKITDLIDEVKEARGEAVRGPSKFNSRLNSLAQPKRSYVQAHSEEYQHRYGRNVITDRLQRLAATPPPPAPERVATASPACRNREKRYGNEVVSAVSLKLPQINVPIERPVRTRHSASNSPEPKDRVSTGKGAPFKQSNVANTPEALKKMVAVESYVKNHYGCAPFSTATVEPYAPQTARAPFVPEDIDMSSISSSPSLQESTELGSKLHQMIDFMVKNPSCGLEVLAEVHEPHSKSTESNYNDISFSAFRCEKRISVDSDFATESTDDGVKLNNKNSNTNSQTDMNMEKIKKALCSTLSVGTFSKRLRMKNLGLTPNTSIPPLFLLQAGDTGSLVVSGSLSEISKSEKILDLKKMPVLSKSRLVDWSFTNIPMQIATVGYAFPEYKCAMPETHSLTQMLEQVSDSSSTNSSLICINPVEKACTVDQVVDNIVDNDLRNNDNEDSQCFVTRKLQPLLEQVSSADVACYAVESQTCPNQSECDNIEPSAKNDCINLNVEHNLDLTIGEQLEEKKTISEIETTFDDKEHDFSSVTPITVDNTASFDVLVGLLNEIKKITTCQTHIARNEMDDGKELEYLLNKTAEIRNSNNSTPYSSISFTNLEKLRCLESNQSVYSYYISDEDADKRNNRKDALEIDSWYDIVINKKPTFVDKETSVNIPRTEFINRLTDVPSICFPITISHSTDVVVTNPLIAELCQTSTQSLFSYHSSYQGQTSKTVLEIPQMIEIKDADLAVSFCGDHQELTKICDFQVKLGKSQTYGKVEKNKKSSIPRPNTDDLNHAHTDPVMKMKRDILVTFYSMLVFTVFAALSVPEMLFHV